jgi:hypothetical protein
MELQFADSCVIDQAETMKQKLLKALESPGKTVLSFKGVTSADISFFMLIHAAKRSFAAKDKELVLTADLPVDLADKARWSGLPELIPPPSSA